MVGTTKERERSSFEQVYIKWYRAHSKYANGGFSAHLLVVSQNREKAISTRAVIMIQEVSVVLSNVLGSHLGDVGMLLCRPFVRAASVIALLRPGS